MKKDVKCLCGHGHGRHNKLGRDYCLDCGCGGFTSWAMCECGHRYSNHREALLVTDRQAGITPCGHGCGCTDFKEARVA